MRNYGRPLYPYPSHKTRPDIRYALNTMQIFVADNEDELLKMVRIRTSQGSDKNEYSESRMPCKPLTSSVGSEKTFDLIRKAHEMGLRIAESVFTQVHKTKTL